MKKQIDLPNNVVKALTHSESHSDDINDNGAEKGRQLKRLMGILPPKKGDKG